MKNTITLEGKEVKEYFRLRDKLEELVEDKVKENKEEKEQTRSNNKGLYLIYGFFSGLFFSSMVVATTVVLILFRL